MKTCETMRPAGLLLLSLAVVRTLEVQKQDETVTSWVSRGQREESFTSSPAQPQDDVTVSYLSNSKTQLESASSGPAVNTAVSVKEADTSKLAKTTSTNEADTSKLAKTTSTNEADTSKLAKTTSTNEADTSKLETNTSAKEEESSKYFHSFYRKSSGVLSPLQQLLMNFLSPTKSTTPIQELQNTTVTRHQELSTTELPQQILETAELRSPVTSSKTLIKVNDSSNHNINKETEDTEDDEDDEEFQMYTFAHFRYDLYYYVDDQISTMNGSLIEELRKMQEKIDQLERQLSDNIAYTHDLESQISAAASLERGSLRLVISDSYKIGAKFGYLQFYTGTAWGFVCDDFFGTAAVKVACRQLGFEKISDTFRSAPVRPGDPLRIGKNDTFWKERFQIVLDDVVCSGKENSIDSCYHSAVGKHDCNLEEAVFLFC